MSSFDVVVIGGGPAGMMAAARAAQYGARTVLIEKNRDLGKKLMITGRGRCNFAHAQNDPEKLAQSYRHGGDFLLPGLHTFGTQDTIAFFLRRGLVSAEERGHRIYPKEGLDAASVVNALWTALKDGGVHVLRGQEVRAFDLLGGKVRRVTTGHEEIDGKQFIVATGGLSFPYTGSTGDGYRFARKAGHTITDTQPALCPVKTAERPSDELHGLKLKNVRVTLTEDGKIVDERFGEMDFTPFGLSGAIIMDMASSIGASLRRTPSVQLHIDLKPALDPERLDARIDRDFEEFSGDALRFAVRKLLPGEIIPTVLQKAKLDMGKPCGQTTKEERAALSRMLKDFIMTPTELFGFRHAIITSGGVKTEEIEPETMRSKLIPNLYFAGEVIDIDGPTGGFNLQECWTTGFVAGSAAAEAAGYARPTDQEIVVQMEQARTRRDERAKEERLQRRAELEASQNTAPEEDAATQEKEFEETMTIQTGPIDDKEFCGWRDPRKKALTGANDIENETRPERNFDERPSRFRDDDRFQRRERNFDERPSRFRGDDRPQRRERSFDERPSRFRENDRPQRRERNFDERPSRFRDDDRPQRRERSFDDRPSRFRDEDRPQRRERNFDERPSRFRNDDRPQHRERNFDERPSRFRDDNRLQRRERNFDERPSRFRDDERPQRRERNFDDRPSRFRDDDRPQRRERNFDDRPSRFRDDDRPQRRERNFDDRPARFRDDDRPQRGERNFDKRPARFRDDERPQRRERSFNDRPARNEHGEAQSRSRRFTDFQKFRKNNDSKRRED